MKRLSLLHKQPATWHCTSEQVVYSSHAWKTF